jgi:hypothetical protein
MGRSTTNQLVLFSFDIPAIPRPTQMPTVNFAGLIPSCLVLPPFLFFLLFPLIKSLGR